MKKSIIISTVVAVVAANATIISIANRAPEVELTPTQIANIEALTQGEGYVEYDKNCQSGGYETCVPNPFQIIENQVIYP